MSSEEPKQKRVKALLLVGGFGTRLRPLTFTKAKPLIELVNKPILVHQIEALKTVGVEEVVLAINYSAEKMFSYLKEFEEKYNIKITCSKEDTPLGTAGPIGLAKNILGEADLIFVFNADIICEYPLKELREFHEKHGKEGTIVTTPVKDPSRFGVIVTNEEGKILDFIEKPQEYVGNNINAGLYLFSKKFLDRVEAKPTSIEREIFPKMAKDGELYSYKLKSFWADVGKPQDYLRGTELYIKSLVDKKSELITPPSTNILSGVVIDKTAKIGEGCVIGPNVVIGAGCEIQKGVRIKNSVIFQNCVLKDYSFIDGSIIGWNCVIGKWCRIQNLSILGKEVKVKDEILVNKNIILPNIDIKNPPKEGEIIMF